MLPMARLLQNAVQPVRKVDSFISDAAACGSPKGLRLQFQEFDNLEASDIAQRYTKYAAGCSAFAAFSGLAPALVSVVQNCPKVTSSDARAVCGTNAGSSLGALIGLAGVAFTAYALHLGKTNIRNFVNAKDIELKRRFESIFEPMNGITRATELMSRYQHLSYAEREEVKDELFNRYLDNPRPVRADPPAGRPALIVTDEQIG